MLTSERYCSFSTAFMPSARGGGGGETPGLQRERRSRARAPPEKAPRTRRCVFPTRARPRRVRRGAARAVAAHAHPTPLSLQRHANRLPRCHAAYAARSSAAFAKAASPLAACCHPAAKHMHHQRAFRSSWYTRTLARYSAQLWCQRTCNAACCQHNCPHNSVIDIPFRACSSRGAQVRHCDNHLDPCVFPQPDQLQHVWWWWQWPTPRNAQRMEFDCRHWCRHGRIRRRHRLRGRGEECVGVALRGGQMPSLENAMRLGLPW